MLTRNGRVNTEKKGTEAKGREVGAVFDDLKRKNHTARFNLQEN